MRKVLVAFVYIASGGAALGAPQAGFQLLPVPARIDVSGYGEVKYMPDVATITYTRVDGTVSSERTAFGLVRQGGELKINSSYVISSG